MKTLEDKLLFWVFLLVILVENKSRNKHVESLLIRRLDEGSIPSDSTTSKNTQNKSLSSRVFEVTTKQGNSYSKNLNFRFPNLMDGG